MPRGEGPMPRGEGPSYDNSLGLFSPESDSAGPASWPEAAGPSSGPSSLATSGFPVEERRLGVLSHLEVRKNDVF